MTMTKKHYKQFANAIAMIKNTKEREKIIQYLVPIFNADNLKFDEERFREWIRRTIKGKSTKWLE